MKFAFFSLRAACFAWPSAPTGFKKKNADELIYSHDQKMMTGDYSFQLFVFYPARSTHAKSRPAACDSASCADTMQQVLFYQRNTPEHREQVLLSSRVVKGRDHAAWDEAQTRPLVSVIKILP